VKVNYTVAVQYTALLPDSVELSSQFHRKIRPISIKIRPLMPKMPVLTEIFFPVH
jgi:hypothetical protein